MAEIRGLSGARHDAQRPRQVLAASPFIAKSHDGRCLSPRMRMQTGVDKMRAAIAR